MKSLATAFAVSAALVMSPPAQARHLHVYHTNSMVKGLGYGFAHMLHFAIEHPLGGRPRAWCGWFMRQQKGVADPSYNLARNWAHWGSPSSLHPGAVVVWNHHVGEAAAGECPAGRVMLHSGNDGHAVRTRCVSLRGVIAIRD